MERGRDIVALVERQDAAEAPKARGIDVFDQIGISVAGAGDVNGDGIDDLIVGAASADDVAGESYVVFGVRTGLAPPIVGGPGPDMLTGGNQNDVFSGHTGSDISSSHARSGAIAFGRS